MKLKLSGVLANIDTYGRCIFALDDTSAAIVARVWRDATPDWFPVRCRLPPYEYVGKRCNMEVDARPYSFVSTAKHNAGQEVSGISFRLITLTPVHT